jgi:uncharacterized protein (TIGR03086 family)
MAGRIRQDVRLRPERRRWHTLTIGDDPIEQLRRALDQTGEIISRVRPDQATLPTPCRSWDVRTLVNHVVLDVQQFAVTAGGGEWEQRHDDVIGDDWTAAYAGAAGSLLAAWRAEGALEATVKLPFGEFPATWRVGQQIADVVVHGWDVAKATGQSTDLDPELGRVALDWARQNLKPEFRGSEESGRSFGAEVPVPADAPVHDRLAGFFGRDP